MVNAFVTLIMVAFMIGGVGLMAGGSFTSLDILSSAWKQREVRAGEISRTEMSVLTSSSASQQIDVTLKNDGKTIIRDFGSWDVIVEYYDNVGTYHQEWFPYTSGVLGDDEWTVVGLYVDSTDPATAEIFEPNIFNPDEEMVIRVQFSDTLHATNSKKVVVATPNGVAVSTTF